MDLKKVLRKMFGLDSLSNQIEKDKNKLELLRQKSKKTSDKKKDLLLQAIKDTTARIGELQHRKSMLMTKIKDKQQSWPVSESFIEIIIKGRL